LGMDGLTGLSVLAGHPPSSFTLHATPLMLVPDLGRMTRFVCAAGGRYDDPAACPRRGMLCTQHALVLAKDRHRRRVRTGCAHPRPVFFSGHQPQRLFTSAADPSPFHNTSPSALGGGFRRKRGRAAFTHLLFWFLVCLPAALLRSLPAYHLDGLTA